MEVELRNPCNRRNPIEVDGFGEMTIDLVSRSTKVNQQVPRYPNPGPGDRVHLQFTGDTGCFHHATLDRFKKPSRHVPTSIRLPGSPEEAVSSVPPS